MNQNEPPGSCARSRVVSRRAVLTAVAGAAAAPLAGALPASAAPLAVHITERAQRVLDIARHHWAAVKIEMAIEGRPGHTDAVARSEALYAELTNVSDAIHESPVRGLADVIERAAVSFAQAERHDDGELEMYSIDPDHGAHLDLLAAVLLLAGIDAASITHPAREV